jgi:hypothetical protein
MHCTDVCLVWGHWFQSSHDGPRGGGRYYLAGSAFQNFTFRAEDDAGWEEGGEEGGREVQSAVAT